MRNELGGGNENLLILSGGGGITERHELCLGLFRYPQPPVEAEADATSVFTEYVFCELVGSAHNLQISSTLQEADCLLKLVKVNKQVFERTLLNRNLNHTAQLSIS